MEIKVMEYKVLLNGGVYETFEVFLDAEECYARLLESCGDINAATFCAVLKDHDPLKELMT